MAANVLTKVRQFLWPIYGKEHKKFLPMAGLIALILFNYTVARNIKDALVVTEGGSETITFLKFWVVVPSAFLFFLIYSKLSNILTKQALFYTVITPFLIFFGLFALVIYPNRLLLHPVESADWLQSMLPAGFKGVISMYRYWTYAIFYTLAELWGSVVMTLMFWQFANDVTRVSEAKRFYAHFYLVANIAVFFAGFATRYFSQIRNSLPEGVDPWGVSLNYLMTAIVLCGLSVLGIYYYLNRYVLPHPDFAKTEDETKKLKKSKTKMSVGESIRFLLHSKYLGLIAILVVSYGISINLVEVSWKHQVALQFPSKNDYSAFMGLLSMTTGISTFLMIFIGSWVLRSLGWKRAVLATPIMIGLTGFMFFFAVVFPDSFTPVAMLFEVTPLMLAVIFGFAQNVLSKATKYSLFDPSKEMSYIPLDDESKMKGKAAVDVVGARLGKSGGSIMQQMMFAFIGPVAVIAPYSAVILLVVISVWMGAVYGLHKRFAAASGEKV